MSNIFLRDSMLRLSIPTRDAAYYIPDGNTVLLVENTLFKVHRSNLMKDGSTFDTLFSLPSEGGHSASPGAAPTVGGTVVEGESDDNPIRLQGDAADEFRALLWALYALPHELMIATTPEANPVLLFNLARITHKYQFKSILAWALGALVTFYSRSGAFDALPGPGDAGCAGGAPTLVQLTELAALCECADLLDAAVRKWREQIADGKDVALAIGMAERLSIRPLMGLAYNAMLLKGRAAWDAEPLLSREQRVRLLSGHYALSRLWEKLPLAPPALSHNVRCASPPRCGKAWAALWRDALEKGAQILPVRYVDVLGKLRVAEGIVRTVLDVELGAGAGAGTQDSGVAIAACCKEAALAATSLKLREVEEGLAEHFTDVP
ncbi:hypothetical protein GLOTRDRAFT_49425 [Gloeophyllum trabeum ATCC 11539]|uniref:BTB domain-containing protein n=1 Tax=Gloeophyllum trabeum (strain ATCC 11539 / FP-39264 / Madison 617) TaxID=670483 RepID=S7RES6_GLOTA|nr:uncharacterized protein GLOTRDRAFT_49425 [Gloeophyllum trabeum ATCC 11539]EPQ50974.1 hypothetical protein GLOTRDRAFT_49425 [Gloeophyllum trabeum ATCC 11539]